MRRFVLAIALACTLSGSALAGDMPTGGIAPPSTNGSTQTTTPTSPGDIPSGGSAGQVSDAALSALLTVLSFITA
jgi:hypothetical protein